MSPAEVVIASLSGAPVGLWFAVQVAALLEPPCRPEAGPWRPPDRLPTRAQLGVIR